jgi:hypothetical protein
MNNDIVFPKIADMRAARQIALDAEEQRWYLELLGEANTRLTEALKTMQRGGHVVSSIRMYVSHSYNAVKELPMAERIARVLCEAGYRASARNDIGGEVAQPHVEIDLT